MSEIKLDLNFVSTEDLLHEILKRKDNQITQAVNQINKNIDLIKGFGISVEHETESIRLLPNFWIDTKYNGEVIKVFYKDEEY